MTRPVYDQVGKFVDKDPVGKAVKLYSNNMDATGDSLRIKDAQAATRGISDVKDPRKPDN